MNSWGYLFIAISLINAAGAIMDWDWYMNNRKARFLSSIITRTGTRIVYVLISLGLLAFGLLVLNGTIEFNPS